MIGEEKRGRGRPRKEHTEPPKPATEPPKPNAILGYCINGFDPLGHGKNLRVHDGLSLRVLEGLSATFKEPSGKPKISSDGTVQIGCSRCRQAEAGCSQCNPEHKDYWKRHNRNSPSSRQSGNAVVPPNRKTSPDVKRPARVWAGSPRVFVPRDRSDIKRDGTMQVGDYAAAHFPGEHDEPYIFFGRVEELLCKKQKMESCSLRDSKVNSTFFSDITASQDY